MSSKDHPDIKISGKFYLSKQIPNDKEILQIGDLKLYDCPDKHGIGAMKGRHTNEGFSGTVRASIWDGSGWRRFKLRSLISNTYFPAQQEKMVTYNHIFSKIPNCFNIKATWDKNQYIAVSKVD